MTRLTCTFGTSKVLHDFITESALVLEDTLLLSRYAATPCGFTHLLTFHACTLPKH